MSQIVKYVILIVILGVIGFLIQDYMYDFPISYVAGTKVTIASDYIKDSLFKRFLIPIVIASVPLLYLFVKKVTQLKSISGLVYFVIFSTGILFWAFRISTYREGTVSGEISNLKEVDFGYYLMFGFITGTVVSILIFRILERKTHL